MLPDAAAVSQKMFAACVLAMALPAWTCAAFQTAMARLAQAAMALLRAAKSRTLAAFAVGQD